MNVQREVLSSRSHHKPKHGATVFSDIYIAWLRSGTVTAQPFLLLGIVVISSCVDAVEIEMSPACFDMLQLPLYMPPLPQGLKAICSLNAKYIHILSSITVTGWYITCWFIYCSTCEPCCFTLFLLSSSVLWFLIATGRCYSAKTRHD